MRCIRTHTNKKIINTDTIRMVRGTSIVCLLLCVVLVAVGSEAAVSPKTTNSSDPPTVGNEEQQPLSTLIEDPPLLVVNPPPQVEIASSAGNKTQNTDRNLKHSLTYDGLYEEGVKHYLENDWSQCVGYLELAIKDYRWYTETLTRCRRDCKGEALAATPLAVSRSNEQEFFETVIKGALCLLKCRHKHFGGSRKQHVAPVSVDREFEIRKPYDYLQLCLFKLGRFQNAADAAVTVLARQPDHDVMANNLRQYIDDFSADADLLQNLELEEYATEYVKGDKAHTDEDYEHSVQHMEAALSLYWRALEDCRLLCEEPYDQGWFPDFVSSVANHFTFTFRCKRRCGDKLGNLYGEVNANFLPSIFNYLQFGYQKLNNITAACVATESYLEMLPADADMIKNKQFYLNDYQKMDRFFIPRPEVVEHAARENYEEALLRFIDTEFVFLDTEKQDQLKETEKGEKTRSLRETLSNMLSSVFSGRPSPVVYKGEL